MDAVKVEMKFDDDQAKQALQQALSSGVVTFTIPPQLWAVVLEVLKSGSAAAVQALLASLRNLDFGPLSPLVVMVVTQLLNAALSYLNKLNVPAPAPSDGGVVVDVK